MPDKKLIDSLCKKHPQSRIVTRGDGSPVCLRCHVESLPERLKDIGWITVEDDTDDV